MLIIDDFRKMKWVAFLREKSWVFENFKNFKAMDENVIENKINYIRYNNGGEFTSKEFDDFLKENGIKRQFTIT